MAAVGEGLPSSFDGRGSQRLQRSEIRKVCLRRVVPLRFVKIENVWLCRKPIKIATHQFSIRSEQLQAQEIRCGNSIRLGDGKGASDAVGFDAQGRVAREFFV